MKQRHFSIFLSILLSMNFSVFAVIFPVEFGTKYGYIDENLNVNQMPIYDSASLFVDGVAVVEKDGMFHIINEDFEMIATIKANYAGRPSCNHIWFSDEKNRYYTDYCGNIIATGFSDVNDFNNGYAIVKINNQIYLMDENNNLNSEFNKYIECSYTGSHFYSVKNKEQKYGIVDETGKIIIPLTHDRVLSYVGRDLFSFHTGKRKRTFDYTGFINMNNQEIIPAIYTEGYVVEDIGFLLQTGDIDKRGIWKLTDTDGKSLYTFPDSVYIDFYTGNHLVIYDEILDLKRLYGWMKVTGEKVTEPIFSDFHYRILPNGYAEAVYNNKNVLVTEDGEIIYVNEIFGLEPVQAVAWG